MIVVKVVITLLLTLSVVCSLMWVHTLTTSWIVVLTERLNTIQQEDERFEQ